MHAVSGMSINRRHSAGGKRMLAFALLLLTACSASSKPNAVADEMVSFELAAATECANWQTRHPEWIFCDDFESAGPLVAHGRYFEYGDNGGDFVPLDRIGVRCKLSKVCILRQLRFWSGLAVGLSPLVIL